MPTILGVIGLTNSNTVSSSFTINSGDNSVSVGPISIQNGVTITISNNANWIIV